MQNGPPTPLPSPIFHTPEPFPKALEPFLKEVGRGKRLARDLTREQSRTAMNEILAGRATEAQIGAYFQAMRIKGETPEELAGIIDALRTAGEIPVHKERPPHRVELGLPYDGRVRGFHISPFAALLASRAGVQTFFHGYPGQGPKFGINAIEVLHGAGIEISNSLEEGIPSLEEDGVAACMPTAFCSPMDSLRRLRDEVVLRGPLATAEKLLDLSGAASHIVGITHTPYAEMVSEAFRCLNWPQTKLFIIQGPEGHADLEPGRQTKMFRSDGDVCAEGIPLSTCEDVASSEPKESSEMPKAPKIDPLNADERSRWIEENVRWGQSVLSGENAQGRMGILRTAALLLLAGGAEKDFETAFTHAQSLVQ